jgi:non-specific protein-tyrosine kinase
LLVGVLAAVLRHALDVSVRSAGLLRRQVGAPTLGVITRNASMGKRPLVVHADPKGSQAEQFRQLRTALQFTNVHRHRKVFLIVSPLSDEGRTATACNLGIALVDAGSRVLLIEADLRHPRAADYLGLDPSIGLTTVLAGDVRLQEAVQRWGENPLEFLASGEVPFNPSELLGSRAMTALLEEARRRYDVVLVDTPPLMPFTDAAAVAPSTDGAILVVRYGRTRRDQVAASVSALEAVSAPVLGSVITMAPGKRGDTFADYSVTSHDGRQDERRQPAAPGRYVAQEPPPDWRPPPPVRAAGVPQRMASTPARPSPVPRQRMHDFDVPDAAS